MVQKRTAAAKRASVAVSDVDDIENCCGWSSDEPAQIQSALLAWYDANHRSLPWRRNPHSKAPHAGDGKHQQLLQVPQQHFIYRVWISEIMCQQTQVARASQYFERWIAKWPDVQSLAAATLDEVNDLWAGLGYYRRAKYLHSGAQHVVENLGGRFPATSKQLQKIPGIGAYTGNAIASIACGEPVAVVDANVVRVLSRLLKISADPASKAAVDRYAAEAATILSHERPGCFNQAMMELGAVMCTGAPKCTECPIRAHCRAYADVRKHIEEGGSPDDAPPVTHYPAKVAKAKRQEQTVAVCVLRSQDADGNHRYLLVKRAEKGLLAGLWEFPSVQQQEAEPSQLNRQASLDLYLMDRGITGDEINAATDRRELGSVQHVFSHIRMTLVVEMLTIREREGGRQAVDGERRLRWVTTEQLAAEGLSSVMRKVADLIDAPAKQPQKQKAAARRKSGSKGAEERVTEVVGSDGKRRKLVQKTLFGK